MAVDSERKRVSLTMIPPGTERRPPERRRHGPSGPPWSESPQAVRGRNADSVPSARRRAKSRKVAPSSRRRQRGAVDRCRRDLRGNCRTRRPPKPRPLPTLTQAKKEGKAYLNTLGELEAFSKHGNNRRLKKLRRRKPPQANRRRFKNSARRRRRRRR